MRSSSASSKNASIRASSSSVRRAALFSGSESPGVGERLGAGEGDNRPPVLGGVVYDPPEGVSVAYSRPSSVSSSPSVSSTISSSPDVKCGPGDNKRSRQRQINFSRMVTKAANFRTVSSSPAIVLWQDWRAFCWRPDKASRSTIRFFRRWMSSERRSMWSCVISHFSPKITLFFWMASSMVLVVVRTS